MAKHRKNELRWKRSAQQVRYVSYNIQSMIFVISPHWMCQSVPENKLCKLQLWAPCFFFTVCYQTSSSSNNNKEASEQARKRRKKCRTRIFSSDLFLFIRFSSSFSLLLLLLLQHFHHHRRRRRHRRIKWGWHSRKKIEWHKSTTDDSCFHFDFIQIKT